jgi:hypothetical protein
MHSRRRQGGGTLVAKHRARPVRLSPVLLSAEARALPFQSRRSILCDHYRQPGRCSVLLSVRRQFRQSLVLLLLLEVVEVEVEAVEAEVVEVEVVVVVLVVVEVEGTPTSLPSGHSTRPSGQLDVQQSTTDESDSGPSGPGCLTRHTSPALPSPARLRPGSAPTRPAPPRPTLTFPLAPVLSIARASARVHAPEETHTSPGGPPVCLVGGCSRARC